MLIGIDASRAAYPNRTGVEEYTYQVIKELARIDHSNRYRFYSDRPLPTDLVSVLPGNFEVKVLPFFRLWTQIRLAAELQFHPVDVFWVPASAMPLIHPRNTVVTIHGLEYEYFPKSYSATQLWYLRFSTKFALRHARKVMAVSENTKKDLVNKYQGDPNQIAVVPNGFSELESATNFSDISKKFDLAPGKYFLFYGRLENRKNIVRLIEAFDIFRDTQSEQMKLVLLGKPGFGYEAIQEAAKKSKYESDIIQTGYLADDDLFHLIKQTQALVFPSLYEGFGLPVLESLSLGTPVICSNTSSLPEVGGRVVSYVNPEDSNDIATKMAESLVGSRIDSAEIGKHLDKFSWQKTARGVQEVLTNSL